MGKYTFIATMSIFLKPALYDPRFNQVEEGAQKNKNCACLSESSCKNYKNVNV